MVESYVVGLPGVRAAQTATPRTVFRSGLILTFLPQGKIIDGQNASDPLNTGDVSVLRAGLLMGKITATGLYGASIIGVLLNAASSGATSLTVSVATATELVRRNGASGTFKLIGPPTANGTVASQTVTYSAVVLATGVITCTAISADYVAGSFVTAGDGSDNMLTLIPDGYGLKVTDVDNTTRIPVQFPEMPVEGIIQSSQIINWPSDTSLQAYIITHLSTAAGGKLVFDSTY